MADKANFGLLGNFLATERILTISLMNYFILPLATALLISSSVTHTYRNGINENSKSKVVSQRNTQQSSLPVDLQTVVNFMAVNGSYVLSYQHAHERFMTAGTALSKSKNASDRTDINASIKEAQADMKRLKGVMVDVHRNPKDWTIEDLQKMKTDPKGTEAFKALVRVRDAMYGDEYSMEIKKYLVQKLQTATPREGEMTVRELRALMDRVQQVGGGKLANTP